MKPTFCDSVSEFSLRFPRSTLYILFTWTLRNNHYKSTLLPGTANLTAAHSCIMLILYTLLLPWIYSKIDVYEWSVQLSSPCRQRHCSRVSERTNKRIPVTATPREICPSTVQHPVMATRLQVSDSQEEKEVNMNHADISSDCIDFNSEFSSTIPKSERVDESSNQLCDIFFKTSHHNKPDENQIRDMKCKFEQELKHLPASCV